MALANIKEKLLSGDLRDVLSRYSDILLAVLVIAIVGIMIIPLPPFLLDIFLATNITLAVTLLMASLYIPNALALASFPTILLIATLFRLALNVSSTRLILIYAYAGEVIESFGSFVVKGNYVVGFVVFVIITIIQFLVIAKGAERVSEVAARFTLDALPGKQMSIDADLRAGMITPDEAKLKRDELQRESQFYGNMDGAMKFVKGDAIAGIIISLINIVAGLVIGVAMKGMTFAEAAKKYTLLTVGDGLVSQIPSLIIATAAGIITTRVASQEGGSLGQDIGVQLLSQPKAMQIAAGMLAGLALIPGLPFIPFITLALITGTVAWSLNKTREEKEKEEINEKIMEPATPPPPPKISKPALQQEEEGLKLPLAVPVIIETHNSITSLVDISKHGARFVQELIPNMREWMFQELGVMFPGVKIRGYSPFLDDNGYAIYINEVPIATGTIHPDKFFIGDNLEHAIMLGIKGQVAPHPDGLRKGMWVSPADAAKMPQTPGTIIRPEEYMAIHLAHVLKNNVSELLGVQDVQNILDLMEKQGFETLVESVVPKLVSVVRLTDILRRLLREEISIRNIRLILEALAEWAPYENDPIYLTEYVRMNLKHYIGYKFSGGNPILNAYILDPRIEDIIEEGINPKPSGSTLSLAPDSARKIIEAFEEVLPKEFKPRTKDDPKPVVITRMEVRYFVKKMLEFNYPFVAVLSYQELPSDLQIQPIARITLREDI